VCVTLTFRATFMADPHDVRDKMHGKKCSGPNIRKHCAAWLGQNRHIMTAAGVCVQELALMCAGGWVPMPAPFTFDEVVHRIFAGETREPVRSNPFSTSSSSHSAQHSTARHSTARHISIPTSIHTLLHSTLAHSTIVHHPAQASGQTSSSYRSFTQWHFTLASTFSHVLASSTM
jgi:hypothetical protein